VAQGIQADDGEFDERGERDRRDARGPAHPRHHHHDHDPDDNRHRWPAEAPSVEVARVVLKVDGSITLKRAAATAWLTAHGHAQPALPIKPTRMELAVVIALAETYGAALYQDARFVPVIDFIADYGAVALVQRVMYGARPDSDDSADIDMTASSAENGQLAATLREARVAFEFLCATWPEVFLAEAHAALSRIGVQVRPTDPEPMPPSSNDRGPDDEHGRDDKGEQDDGEEGGHG
jgi:hypothetical protein